MAFVGAPAPGGAHGRDRFPPLLARERVRRSSGDSAAPSTAAAAAAAARAAGREGDASSSGDSGCEAPARGWRRGRDVHAHPHAAAHAPAEPWGAASLPIVSPAPPPAAPPSPTPSTLLSQLHVPIGIGVPGSTATIPVRAHPRSKPRLCARRAGVLTWPRARVHTGEHHLARTPCRVR
jgi:hypothetical protein